MPTIPKLTWAQDKKQLFVTVDLRDIKEDNCQLEKNKLLVDVVNKEDVHFKHEFVLQSEIDKEKISKELTARNLKITITKIEEGYWEHLLDTINKKLFKNLVQIDWNLWKDEDEEDSEPADMGGMPPGMDMSQMMGGMPPGGMPPGMDMSQMMGGMPPGGMPPGMDMSQMMGGMPPGMDMSQMMGGMPPGMDMSQMMGGMPPGGMPPGMDMSQMMGNVPKEGAESNPTENNETKVPENENQLEDNDIVTEIDENEEIATEQVNTESAQVI